MWCSGLPWIYGQLVEGQGQPVMKMSWCNGLSEIHAELEGVHQPKVFSVMVFHGSIDDWRSGWVSSCHEIIWCNGLPEIHAQLEGGSISQQICQVWCNGIQGIYAQLVGLHLPADLPSLV